MRWRRGTDLWADLGTGIFVRLAFALTALAIGAYQNRALIVAPWVGAVVAADLLQVALDRFYPEVADRWRLVTVGLFLAVTMVAVQGVGAPVIPLTFVPAVYAGVSLGRKGVLLVGWVSLVTPFAMAELTSHHNLHGIRILILMGAVTLATLIASFWHRQRPDEEQLAAGEARDLLIRLSSLADSLDTGFDVPALGDAALEETAAAVPLERAALLLRHGDDAIPVGLFGHTRVPWPPPTDPGSALTHSWEQGVAVRRVFGDDPNRRYLLTVPVIGTDGGVIGMFAMDREHEPFSPTDQRQVEVIADRVAPLVEVGVLFSRLRGRAALEERTRLARDMHDGVAQDLAALSFSVDILLQQTAKTEPVYSALESLRTAMRESLSDIRHQISTLRMVERPDVSFGSILSAALQGFGQTGLRTTLTLDESPFRLPAHLEIQIQRIALDLLADARTSGATFVDWDIRLAAPNARLVLMHDGATRLSADSFARQPLQEHALIIVDALIPAGLFVDITIGTDPRPHGRRTLSAPEPARSVNSTPVRDHTPAEDPRTGRTHTDVMEGTTQE
ncbi:MAG TPA: hypothetical protein GXZ60_06170 [Intrasporangiaceae bacterium]|nr:hypothetical protein [Intrasporangiaceae bacterium]